MSQNDAGPLAAAIGALLADPSARLLPLILNPPAFPGEEEWAFYDAVVRPLLERHGWVLEDEHVPIACAEHWRIELDNINESDVDEGPLGSIAAALLLMEPVSDAARAYRADPATLTPLAVAVTPLVRAVIAEVGRLGRAAPLNVDVPGEGLSAYGASDMFAAVVRDAGGGSKD